MRPPGQRQPAQRGRRRVARARRGAKVCPIVNVSRDVRYPVLGATFQPRAGIAKHDHVAWAFARAADALGVDLIQNCEVTGFVKRRRPRGRRRDDAGPHQRRHGRPRRGRPQQPCSPRRPGSGCRSSAIPLQALVSELLEPVHPTVVMSNHVHVYVCQAHKGELVMGAGIDAYNGYGQRGSFHVIERQMAAALELFPIFARAHVLRTWAGIVDVSPGRLADHRPDAGREPLRQLRLGHRRVQGDPRRRAGRWPTRWQPVSRTRSTRPFALQRFTTGALVDEHGAAGVAH